MRIALRIPRGSRVLDVGCGSGSITEILRETTGADIVGIEPDEQRAQHARARGLTVINDYLSPSVIHEHGTFDFVIFADVLEHLPNPAQIVALAKEVVKPGGSLLVSVPNAAHFYARVDLLRGVIRNEHAGIWDATHLRWFTRATLQRFFERLDFEIIYQSYTAFVGMHMYATRKPFSLMSPPFRARVIRRLAAWNPRLFAVQHIIQVAPKALLQR